MQSKLREADFAVFVLPHSEQAEYKNTMYEIGVCDGLGIPFFIVLTGKPIDLPFFLKDAPFASLNSEDKDFLKVSINAFINNAIQKRSSRRKKSHYTLEHPSYGPEIRNKLHSLESQVAHIRANRQGLELESLLATVFDTIGITHVRNPSGRDRGVDFAIWSNELASVIGNPIIAEAKTGRMTDASIDEPMEQIQKYLTETGARFGILFYLDIEGRRISRGVPYKWPNIIAFDVEDFIQELQTLKFDTIILVNRNALVHALR